MGMFEQSLLLDHAAGKKTGALAASLTMQTLGVAVLIALPLIYSDRLPDIHPFISLSLPLPPPPPAPVHVEAAPASRASHLNLATTRIFSAPRRIVPLSEIPQISSAEAPPTYSNNVDRGVPGGLGVPSLLTQLFHEAIPQPKPHVVEPEAPAKPTVVGGDVQNAKLLRKIVPLYPPLAKQARVSGTVRLLGVIAKDGTIQQLQVVSGHPLLVKAALDAVRQWIYRPTLLDGKAVEVIAPIDVIFTLSQ